MKPSIKHTIGLGALLFLLWLSLSGQFDPLMLSLGAASTIIVVLLSNRVDRFDKEPYPFRITLLLLRFLVQLAKDIVLSNVDVVKRIITPGDTISPRIIDLELKHRSILARVMYANSITLTPGTVTMSLGRDKVRVHALSREAAEDLETGRMEDYIPDDWGPMVDSSGVQAGTLEAAGTASKDDSRG